MISLANAHVARLTGHVRTDKIETKLVSNILCSSVFGEDFQFDEYFSDGVGSTTNQRNTYCRGEITPVKPIDFRPIYTWMSMVLSSWVITPI